MRCELIATIPVRNLLGECILWDDRSRHVWWTDIQSRLLFRYEPQSTELRQFELPERLGSFGLIDRGSQLICAFESGFALFDSCDGSTEWLARPELGFTGTRFNDGRVDRRGRFWAGTMVEREARDADGRPASGSLYRLAGNECRRVFGGIRISNSLCFSPDGPILYFADSPTGRINAYELNAESGDPGRSQVFADVDNGVPDGPTVDAEGYLWNAQWGGGKVVRYAPSGSIDFELELPTTQPTCVCLGGEKLDHLFVTTATVELDPESLAAQPEAGNVLIIRTPLRGIAESRFKG
jgi:sugar lactone lactonase YvrE